MLALSEYVGAGTPFPSHDPCRPRGFEQVGMRAIDLRADGGASPTGDGLNQCLVYLPSDQSDGGRIRKVADDPDEVMGGANQDALESRLGKTWARGETARQWMTRLLLDPPATGWAPLRPTPHGEYVMTLGPAQSRVRGISGGAVGTESFNAADSSTLGPDLSWVEFTGTGFAIQGNALHAPIGMGLGEARADFQLAGNDFAVEMDLTNWTCDTVDDVCYLAVLGRVATSGQTFYMVGGLQNASVTNEVVLGKIVGGTETTLQTRPTTMAAGGRFQLRMLGSLLLATYGSLPQLSVTDTAIDGVVVGGRYGGLRAAPSNGGTAKGDNFRVADYAAIRPHYRDHPKWKIRQAAGAVR
jgi:hypothetical protein